MQLSPSRDFNLKYSKPIHGFSHHRNLLSHRHQTILKLGVYSCPLCRCLLDKLRQSSVHTISKDAIQTWQTPYTQSYNGYHANALHSTLLYSVEWMMHCTRAYNENFEKDVLHSDIQCGFLKEYYTRMYSIIFNGILYSDA